MIIATAPPVAAAPEPAAAYAAADAVFAVIFAALVLLAAAVSIGVILWKRLYVPGRARLELLSRPVVAPSAEGPRLLPPLPAMVLLLGGLLVWLAAQIGGGVGAALAAGVSQGDDFVRAAVMAAAGYIGGFAACALLLALLPQLGGVLGLRSSWREIGRGGIALLLIAPIMTAAGMLAFWLAGAAARLAGDDAPSQIAHETLRRLIQRPAEVWWWVQVLLVLLVAPLFEELVYRGFLQSALLRATGSQWAAVLPASALFALVHMSVIWSPQSPFMSGLALLLIFTLSVGLGLVYERTGSLAAPIVVHAGFNGLNLVQAFITGNG